jgi:hypothetical protein
MRRLASMLLAALLLAAVAPPPPPETLYQSMYIVNGTGPEQRAVGFREALRRQLVKVSGDRRLLDNPAAQEMVQDAQDYVAAYSYLDLKFGVPVHDEQGTRERQHYLTVTFDAARIDAALAQLGSKPWKDRPRLHVFVTVRHDPIAPYVVDAASKRDQAMRDSFGEASLIYGLPVAFPAPDAATRFASENGAQADIASGEVALTGVLTWSDADLGWVAEWTIARNGSPVHWQVRGVNFDEAFRQGLGGAALVLSGNGTP